MARFAGGTRGRLALSKASTCPNGWSVAARSSLKASTEIEEKMGTVKRQSRGLPLVDLFLVATLILLIIVAMAIPHVDRSRMAANQASAVGALRTIDTAETGYASAYHTGYSPTLAALGPPLSGNGTASAAGLIDCALA